MRLRFFNTHEPVTSYYRDLGPYLAREGAQVEICMSGAENRTARSGLEEALNHPGIRITRLPSVFKVQRGAISRVGIILSYALSAVVYTLLSRGTDLNVFLSQPPMFSCWGLVLKLIRRQPYCCVVMDVYPDVYVRDGLLKENSPAFRILRRLMRLTWRNAAAVVVIGRCMRELVKDAGVEADRIHVIPNWTNAESVCAAPGTTSTLRVSEGLGKQFVVLYSGNLGVSHFFDDVLEAARRLKTVNDLKFVFIGEGSRCAEIEKGIAGHGLDNVLLLPLQPAEQLADSLCLGDVHFICLRPGFEGLVVPSKAYSALAVGRPIIYQGSGNGEIARMIAEERIGAVVSPHDPLGMEKAVLGYYEDRSLVDEQGRRAAELSLTRYSLQNSLKKYREVLFAASKRPAPSRRGDLQLDWAHREDGCSGDDSKSGRNGLQSMGNRLVAGAPRSSFVHGRTDRAGG
ncbi:glycosyltransferase family 4 protein [Syntrophobacter fumaroxidans]|uniref:Glycosyl transferase, group 1 n=1 Tax=Syntrophobacter fumaroxidans (strain DSM 10017 / MPOB) TaxID=335543 RepID=A0LGD7_SYNFM|nr:glycosyltransferase family 4 protein [Syntrophobacter fumaroxidans]ABK16489.1 glycosyl transferase, group 1 [Syntrophobacter fumaroxidans MPOB]